MSETHPSIAVKIPRDVPLCPKPALWTLLWRPWMVANAAAHCPNWLAMVVGVPAFAACWFVPIGSAASVAEPFATVLDYATSGLIVAGVLAVVFGVFIAVVLHAGWMCWMVGWTTRPRDPRETAAVRVLLINGIPFALPHLILAVFLGASELSDPNFGLYRQAKPTWIFAPWVEIIGSPAWLGVGWALFVANLFLNLYLVSRIAFNIAPVCKKCGYNLTGNTSGVCPECGKAIRYNASAGVLKSSPTSQEN